MSTAPTPDEVAATWVRAHTPGATGAVQRAWPALPGVFVVETVPSDGAYVVVQGGDVVLDRGLVALAGYLDHIDAFPAASLTADDLLRLLDAFEAWPTPPDPEAYPPGDRPFSSRGAAPAYDPSLRFHAGGATLTLHYERATTYPEGIRVGGSRTGRTPRTFWAWTVTFAPHTAPITSGAVVTAP